MPITTLESGELEVQVECPYLNKQVAHSVVAFEYTPGSEADGVEESISGIEIQPNSDCKECIKVAPRVREVCELLVRCDAEERVWDYIAEQKELSKEQHRMDNYDEYKRRYF